MAKVKIKAKKKAAKAARTSVPKAAKKKAKLLKVKKLREARSNGSARIIKKAKPEKSVRAAKESSPALKAISAAPKGLTPELLQIRERLQHMLADKRNDIDREVHGASERDLAHINDSSDMASDAAEGELALRIAETETVAASEIERAIEKIDNGTYGSCEMCNKVIGADRLHFLPYVTLCIKCQELAEIRKREDEDELDDLAEGSDGDQDN